MYHWENPRLSGLLLTRVICRLECQRAQNKVRLCHCCTQVGLCPSQLSSRASSPVCCTKGTVCGALSHGQIKELWMWCFSGTLSSEWLNSPSSWPWGWLEVAAQTVNPALPFSTGPSGNCWHLLPLNGSWRFLFAWLPQIFQIPLKPLKVFDIELKGRLLSLSNVDSKTVGTYRNYGTSGGGLINLCDYTLLVYHVRIYFGLTYKIPNWYFFSKLGKQQLWITE